MGCFYEFYQAQARKARELFQLQEIPGKYGFRERCGIGVNPLECYVALALQQGCSVIVVKQTGTLLPYMAERRVAIQYIVREPILSI